MTEPIHGRCLICFEDKPFDVFRTGCGLPPNDVVGVCKDCTAAAVTARNARRVQPDTGKAPDAGDVEALRVDDPRVVGELYRLRRNLETTNRGLRTVADDLHKQNEAIATLHEQNERLRDALREVFDTLVYGRRQPPTR